MMYIAVYKIRNKYPACLTRYPVINLGSVFPSKVYLKVTTTSRKINLTLNNITEEYVNYPKLDESFYNSLSVPGCYLGVLDADFDGDMMSFNVLYTDESIKEINDLLDNKSYYIRPDGEIAFSPITGTLEYVVKTMADKTCALYE